MRHTVWNLGSSPRRTPDLGRGLNLKRHSREAAPAFSAPQNGEMQFGGAKQTGPVEIRY